MSISSFVKAQLRSVTIIALCIVSYENVAKSEDYSFGDEFQDCQSCPVMVVIPPGEFIMGSPSNEEGLYDTEGPQHEVTLPRNFAVGKYEVTRGEYAQFANDTGRGDGGGCNYFTGDGWKLDTSKSWRSPGFSQNDDDPVACVNWDDAQAYVSWLARKTSKSYRLLSEAEWEYAARAGTTTAYYFGNSISSSQANHNQNEGKTVSVGSYAANAFGLHDMHGNVWEWAEDCWNGSYSGAPSDGSAWMRGDCDGHVLRGGSWLNYPQDLRSAYRVRITTGYRYNNVGFRVARTLD